MSNIFEISDEELRARVMWELHDANLARSDWLQIAAIVEEEPCEDA